MNGTSTTTNSLEELANTVRGIQSQLASLQRQGAIIARVLSNISAKLDEISAREGEMEQGIDNIEDEVAQIVAAPRASALCPACGAPLQHHPAPGGDLRICSACGFSQFVDVSGIARTSSLPPTTPCPDDHSPPPSWVA